MHRRTLAQHHDVAPARAARIRSDIEGDNAAVLLAGFAAAVPSMVALAWAGILFAAVVSTHGRAPVSLVPVLHRFVAGAGISSLGRFLLFVALGVLAVMLQSLVCSRRAAATELVEQACEALEVLRSFFVGRVVDAPGAGRPIHRRFVLVAHQVEHGISTSCAARCRSPQPRRRGAARLR